MSRELLHEAAEQYASLEHQHETQLSGMWLFLGTEVLFFGALFLAYTIYRTKYPEVFDAYSKFLNVYWGTLNTGVLLTSSLFMALGVQAAKEGKGKRVAFLLSMTLILGLVFLAIKGNEWHHDFEEGLVPGKWFTYSGMNSDLGELFFRLYFVMTGLHALHVIIGLGIFVWLIPRAFRGRYSGPENYLTIELVGLYWHFVDLVWIFLYPLFYLIKP